MKLFRAMLFVFCISIVTSCNMDSCTTGLSISGILPVSSSKAIVAGNNSDIDVLYAFPIVSNWGFITPQIVSPLYRVDFPVSESGDFQIDISKLNYSNYVFVFADTDIENPLEQLSTFLAIDDGDNTLSIINIDDIIQSFDLQEMTNAGDESVSSTTLIEVSDFFGERDYNSLSAIAQADNAVKVISNFWRNYDPVSDNVWNIRMSRQLFIGSIDKTQLTTEFSNPNEYSVSQNTIELSFRTENGTGNADYLKSPIGTQYTAGISADGGTAYSYFCVVNEEISSGDWILYATDGSVLAEADFSINASVGSNQVPVGFVPAIKVNVSNDIVESIEVKWFYNNDVGILTEEMDLSVVSSIVLGGFIQYNGGGTGYPDTGGTFALDLSNNTTAFVYGDGMHFDVLSTLEFKYSMMGMMYEIMLWYTP